MLTPFPADCCALVVGDELDQALDLTCMLAGFGCRVIGPAASTREALQLLGGRCPSFALFDADLPASSLVLLAEMLIRLNVPFAVLTTGLEHPALDRLSLLREAPRLSIPFNPRKLHQTASALHHADLRRKIVATDGRISEGRVRLAQQIRLIEQLEAAGTPTAPADSLLHEIGRALRTMRASRTILCQQLETYQV
jgi:two-component system, response regulator PdtaR